jgi:hypothetical protein
MSGTARNRASVSDADAVDAAVASAGIAGGQARTILWAFDGGAAAVAGLGDLADAVAAKTSLAELPHTLVKFATLMA